MNEEKEVYFDQYCKSCKYHGLEESKDPLILRRNFAIAKKLREKLHRQNLFTKLVASLNRHGSIKSDISERRKET
jgi:hypothetical protein